MGTRIGVRVGPVTVSDNAPGCGPGCLLNGLIVATLGTLTVFLLAGGGAHAGTVGRWVALAAGVVVGAGTLVLLVATNVALRRGRNN